ncbi:SAM-dependent methyltransferase [Brevirhabdus pacifica]|uniref:SAM-dependent methyltransferase n=1 Tax=Brevirhabdus pacifica TaxID=1267768 RepID=A0A1U7DIN7_9RHOB|nr:methyltransferase domain-containing protein [Brevirhabdus pacifica]APX89852.1 SAM-dependent methyltransferase [Brevirhabdus pacifica]PJJ82933.1 hypothetical protein CLV77_2710 [Brevirhabdus pacifica]
MPAPPEIFDRAAVRLHRDRARHSGDPGALFLHDIAIDEIQQRLSEVKRTFTDIVIVTGHPETWAPAFPGARVIEDTATLEVAEGQADLVIHAMALHLANDPVGQIVQCGRALRPDGLFLAAAPGGETLTELRSTLAEAEIALSGGLSPRVSPMAEIRDMGGLLQRAGLALPVADAVKHRASYPSLTALMHDLRAMGEANALAGRLRHATRRALFERAQTLYQQHFPDTGTPPDGAPRLLATFEILFLTAWRPDSSQPRPARPGSASHSLAEALNAIDIQGLNGQSAGMTESERGQVDE